MHFTFAAGRNFRAWQESERTAQVRAAVLCCAVQTAQRYGAMRRVKTSVDKAVSAELCSACGGRDLSKLRRVLTYDSPSPAVLDSPDGTGTTPLQYAVAAKSATLPTIGTQMVLALLRAGASVNATGAQGATALHTACMVGAPPTTVHALLDATAGASRTALVNAKLGETEQQALHVLALHYYGPDARTIAGMLLEAGASGRVYADVFVGQAEATLPWAAFAACSRDHYTHLMAAVTPLHMAAMAGNAHVLAELTGCDSGVAPRQAETGWTPLHWAVQLSRAECVAMLLVCGADPLAAATADTPGTVTRSVTAADVAAGRNNFVHRPPPCELRGLPPVARLVQALVAHHIAGQWSTATRPIMDAVLGYWPDVVRRELGIGEAGGVGHTGDSDGDDDDDEANKLPPVPNELVCPITLVLMRYPVRLCGDGHVYERTAIQRWLRSHHTSPLTGLHLEGPGCRNLLPDAELRERCAQERSVRAKLREALAPSPKSGGGGAGRPKPAHNSRQSDTGVHAPHTGVHTGGNGGSNGVRAPGRHRAPGITPPPVPPRPHTARVTGRRHTPPFATDDDLGGSHRRRSRLSAQRNARAADSRPASAHTAQRGNAGRGGGAGAGASVPLGWTHRTHQSAADQRPRFGAGQRASVDVVPRRGRRMVAHSGVVGAAGHMPQFSRSNANVRATTRPW